MANWWNSLPYKVQGAIMRFVRLVVFSAFTSLSAVQVGIMSPREAVTAFTVAFVTALMAGLDKLAREWSVERASRINTDDPVIEGDDPAIVDVPAPDAPTG